MSTEGQADLGALFRNTVKFILDPLGLNINKKKEEKPKSTNNYKIPFRRGIVPELYPRHERRRMIGKIKAARRTITTVHEESIEVSTHEKGGGYPVNVYQAPQYQAPHSTQTMNVDDKPAFLLEDVVLPWTPYMLSPEVEYINRKLIPKDKNNLHYLFHIDNICRMIGELYCASVIGDGVHFMVTQVPEEGDEESFEINEDATTDLITWLEHCGGEKRGMVDYVIPRLIIENLIHGHSVVYWFLNEENEWELAPLDPLSYVIKMHDHTRQRGVVQFPVRQVGLPSTREEFERWMPAWMNPRGHFSSTGLAYDATGRPLATKNTEIIDLFREAPMYAAADYVKEKQDIRENLKRYLYSFASPIPVMTVPFNPRRTEDDADFYALTSEVSARMADIRQSDAFAIPGTYRDANGSLISDAWNLDLVSPSESYDFIKVLEYYNSQIALALMTPMSLVQATGTQLSTSKVMESLHHKVAVKIRTTLERYLKALSSKYLRIIGYKDIQDNQIRIKWTKMKEEDAAAYATMLSSLLLSGALDRSEVRNELRKVGIVVPPQAEYDLDPLEAKAIEMQQIPVPVDSVQPGDYKQDNNKSSVGGTQKAKGKLMGVTGSPSTKLDSSDSDRKAKGPSDTGGGGTPRRKSTGKSAKVPVITPSQSDTAGRTRAGTPGKGAAGGYFRRTKSGSVAFVKRVNTNKMELHEIPDEVVGALGLIVEELEVIEGLEAV